MSAKNMQNKVLNHDGVKFTCVIIIKLINS